MSGVQVVVHAAAVIIHVGWVRRFDRRGQRSGGSYRATDIGSWQTTARSNGLMRNGREWNQ